MLDITHRALLGNDTALSRRSEPPPYYTGHPREAEIHQARQNLSKLPWRIICAHMNDAYFYENVHRYVVVKHCTGTSPSCQWGIANREHRVYLILSC